MGQQWTAVGAGVRVQQTWVWHKPSWRRSPLTHHRVPELTQGWETGSQRAQTEPCVHQDPGKRSSDPTRACSRLARECPGDWRRRELVVAYCRVGGTECGSTCMRPFEGGRHYLHYLHHSLASSQNNKEGTEPHPSTESESEVAQLCLTLCNPMDYNLRGASVHRILQARVLEWVALSFSTSTENWIKNLLSMASPIRTRPSFPLSQSLPLGSFHKPLILLHQRADRLKTKITKN